MWTDLFNKDDNEGTLISIRQLNPKKEDSLSSFGIATVYSHRYKLKFMMIICFAKIIQLTKELPASTCLKIKFACDSYDASFLR